MAEKRDLRIAVICASNMNRSMAIHDALVQKKFDVKSYGIGSKVCIPGDQPNTSNIYNFGITYEEIYNQLKNENEKIYASLGLLSMLDRNRRLKARPERFQDSTDKFDLMITCEKKIYDKLINFMENKTPEDFSTCHVINLDIQDSIEEALERAHLISELCTTLNKCQDLDYEIEKVLKAFQINTGMPYIHRIVFN